MIKVKQQMWRKKITNVEIYKKKRTSPFMHCWCVLPRSQMYDKNSHVLYEYVTSLEPSSVEPINDGSELTMTEQK